MRLSSADPELRLLIACAGFARGGAGPEPIAELLDENIDWNRFLEWAMRHHLTPMLFGVLSEVSTDRVPTNVFAALKVALEKNRKEARHQVAELVRIDKALRGAGIVSIPFKGPALAYALGSDAGERVAGDLDFFVPPGEADRTLEVLAGLGYGTPGPEKRLVWQSTGQVQAIHREHQTLVEPHWAVAHRVFGFKVDYEGLWTRAKSQSLNDHSLCLLCPPDLIILLCLHGSKEHWIRLKWVCDIAAFSAANPELDWNVTLERAGDWGCRRMLLLGLMLAEDLLSAPLPAGLRREIDADPGLPRLARSVHGGLCRLDQSLPDIWRINRFRWHMHERWSDRLRYALFTIASPRESHLTMVALPRGLRWGYWIIRCVHDYVALPLWTLLKARRSTQG